MNIRFKNNRLQKQCSNASEMKRAFGINAVKVSRRLTEMKQADNLKVLMQLPAAECHPLTGDRKGQWAVSISRNFRVLFELDENPIPYDGNEISLSNVRSLRIIDIEDYH
jgi:plasmid maintenance system killer protein